MKGAAIDGDTVSDVFGGSRSASGLGVEMMRSRRYEDETLNTTGDGFAGRYRWEDIVETRLGGIMVDILCRVSANGEWIRLSSTHTIGCVSDVCQCGCGSIVADRSSPVWGRTIDVEIAAESCSRRSTIDKLSGVLVGKTSLSPRREIQTELRLIERFRGRLYGHQAGCSAHRV